MGIIKVLCGIYIFIHVTLSLSRHKKWFAFYRHYKHVLTPHKYVGLIIGGTYE